MKKPKSLKEIDKLIKIFNETFIVDETVDPETNVVFDSYRTSNRAYEKIEEIFPAFWVHAYSKSDNKLLFALDVLHYIREKIKEDEK